MKMSSLTVPFMFALALTLAPALVLAGAAGGGGGGGGGNGGGGGGGGGRGADMTVCKKGSTYDRKAGKCRAKHSMIIPSFELIEQG